MDSANLQRQTNPLGINGLNYVRKLNKVFALDTKNRDIVFDHVHMKAYLQISFTPYNQLK